MTRVLAIAIIALASTGLVAGCGLDVAESGGPHAAVVSLDSVIDPVSVGYLSRGIDSAVSNGAHFIVIVADTSGGLMDSTREMVEKILAGESWSAVSDSGSAISEGDEVIVLDTEGLTLNASSATSNVDPKEK